MNYKTIIKIILLSVLTSIFFTLIINSVFETVVFQRKPFPNNNLFYDMIRREIKRIESFETYSEGLKALRDVHEKRWSEEPNKQSLKQHEFNKLPSSTEIERPPKFMGEHRPEIWIVNDAGEILASTSKERLPIEWDNITKPLLSYEIKEYEIGKLLSSKIIISKLNKPEPVYLLIYMKKFFPFHMPPDLIFMVVVLGVITFLFGIFIVIIYMRSKSKEAKELLSKMEKGDLKVRFKVKKLDQVGNLMLDFNRMVDRIESLVLQLKDVERVRSYVMQEYGHDLRTPLASLKTSVEVLGLKYDSISQEQRRELAYVIRNEMDYFIKLLEDVFFLSELSIERFKTSKKKLDLKEVLKDEVKKYLSSISNLDDKKIKYELKEKINHGDIIVEGDYFLLQRLFRNILENSVRHARTKIIIILDKNNEQVVISFVDDGQGMSDEELEMFGKRKNLRRNGKSFENKVSLGVGSVIIKQIVGIHNGKFDLHNNKDQNGNIIGFELKLTLPVVDA